MDEGDSDSWPLPEHGTGEGSAEQPGADSGVPSPEPSAVPRERSIAHRSARQQVLAALADHIPMTLRGARWQMSGRAVAAVVVVLSTAVGAAALVAGRDAPEMITPTVEVTTAALTPDASETIDEAPLPTTTEPVAVVVHVAGLVAEPGVLALPVGSRVVDALEAAGGAQPGVDTSSLNLARVLVDGEQIAVGVPAAPDAGGVPAPGGGPTPAPGAPLDLNTATEADLDTLPGVGPVLAGRIVAWREEHGAFTAVEELLEVTGIGTATLADLVGLVQV